VDVQSLDSEVREAADIILADNIEEVVELALDHFKK
jgi:hypothetical protein